MDAISFVLGVKSSHLRSSQLKDLIYRGRRDNQDSDESDNDNENDSQDLRPKKAWVKAVYETSDGDELNFLRTYASILLTMGL